MAAAPSPLSPAAPGQERLTVRRVLPAPRERVFKAWTEPTQMRQWACPHGFSVDDAQVDLRVGGSYRIAMRSPNGEVMTTSGTYQEISPPMKLVYTWQWDWDQRGATLVTVEFRERGAQTELVLVHERFPTAEDRDQHQGGWNACVDKLEALLAA